MNSAVKTFLFASGGFVVGTLLLILVASEYTEMFLRNLAYLEVSAGALCFFFRDKL